MTQLFQVTKQRFIDEIQRWCSAQGKFANFVETDDSFYFYLTTPTEDYGCIVPKTEITGSDKMNLFSKSKEVVKRIKDNEEIIEVLAQEEIAKRVKEKEAEILNQIQNRNILSDAVQLAVQNALKLETERKKAEEALQGMVTANGSKQIS